MADYGTNEYWKEELEAKKFKYDVIKAGVTKMFAENPDNIEKYLRILSEAKSEVDFYEEKANEE